MEIKKESFLNLTEYQSEAIVSKTIIKKDSGSITLFAFDKGEELSEHTSSFDAVVSIIEGRCEIKISGNTYILESGEMIIMPADEPHGLKALTRFKMILTMLK